MKTSPETIGSTIARAVIATALVHAATASAQQVAPVPMLPEYGQAVAIELRDAPWPTYLPATRYTRSGPAIDIDFEYVPDGFGPISPTSGPASVALGELAPGNYQVRARLHDASDPSAQPIELFTQIAVRPPTAWGIYTLPAAPQAFSATHAVVRSAAYFDPTTLVAKLAGNVVRVEFDYRTDASYLDPAPPRTSTFGTVRIPDLAPGAYRLEGWGRAGIHDDHEIFFARDFTVASTVPVIEYYSALLDHYFIAAGSDEVDLVDRGAQGDWKRTGQRFSAWARAADAPAGALPVCRFYAYGPNSHFYTAGSDECASLRALELRQRAEASARGEAFLGWGYEGTAFWADVASAGQCPAGLAPVYRAYNDRAAEMDSNHRFMPAAAQRDAMSFGWVHEGTQLCTAP